MYDDEVRDPTVLHGALAQELVSHPDRVFAHVEELRTREALASATIRDLEGELRKLRGLREQNRDLTRRLGSAIAALDAYRAESARLKGDLKRLRGSRSYRLGRSMTRPMGVVRSVMPAPRTRTPADPTPDSDGLLPVAAQPARRLGDYTFEELVDRFQEEKSAERLGHVLSRAWYHEGLVSLPAGLLRAHPDLSQSLDPASALLAQRILGTERLARTGPVIPPKAAGTAYRSERGRVMYCAHSTPFFNTNGYATRTRGLVTGLRAAGVDVAVVARSGYPWDSPVDRPKPDPYRHVVQIDGVDYVHLTGAPLAGSAVDDYVLQCADAYVREARLQRPSLIHAASNFQTGLAGLIAARRVGVPFVYEVRGLWEVTEASTKPGWEATERFRFQAELETLVAREADAVLAITQQTKDELVRRGVDPTRVSLAPNAVDPTVLLPLPKDEQFAEECGVRTDVPIIGFAGSLVAYEGLDLLIEAAALLRDDGLDFQIVLAGSGSEEAQLKAQVGRLGLEGQVIFLGRMPAASMPRLFSLFDIMPCPRPSLPVTEMVSPLKPLEALSSGKAVILSDVAPHRDIAGTEADRALLFPAGDAHALAAAIAEVCARPDLRADLGRAGRLWCLDERTWAHVAERVQDTYARASNRHRDLCAGSPGRRLADLRVGLVADEFTTKTLRPSVQLVPLERDRWRAQLEGLDLVLIESAWHGNDDQWHRGVGHYEPEEYRDISELLAAARALGIPSAFWNKEDPVHFGRFVATASMCDHVFTTDADRILPYLAAGRDVVRTVSSLPFFAQPLIHNPLPGRRESVPTVAYAGTYYGDRYPTRSAELEKLLEAAADFGLTIYDRQASVPDTPYHFPRDFQRAVKGSLPYDEVIDSYKAHLANLNVNSVADSPSMFSRRVVEVAACGGVVLSGPGHGIDETFGGAIPASADPDVLRAYLRLWTSSPAQRLREAWLQMRTVFRAHTAQSALTVVARTAGLPVGAERLPEYAVEVRSDDPAVIHGLARQSVLPAEVFVPAGADLARRVLDPLGVGVHGGSVGDVRAGVAFLGVVTQVPARSHFEDLLLAAQFGVWERIIPSDGSAARPDVALATPVSRPGTSEGLVAVELLDDGTDLDQALGRDGVRGLEVLLPPPADHGQREARALSEPGRQDLRGRKVVLAGHDLKFAGHLIRSLESVGAEVELDEWASHVDHDEQRSHALLDWADVIFCEWGLGNAVWYSRHLAPHQRLVVRVHLQELFRPYLRSIWHSNVDAFVFVGELIRAAAVGGHGVPPERSVVIPNAVDVEALRLEKTDEALRTLGMVGIVPQRKRLDLALDVLEELLTLDPTYRLRIKGKRPHDYPWMLDRAEEMAYYDAQADRVAQLNARYPNAVTFDGHGDDMAEWYRNIGVALSVSDFESFHLTIADGAASGAMPASLAWPGSDLIYPREWLAATPSKLAARIATDEHDPVAVSDLIRRQFGADVAVQQLIDVVAGAAPGPSPEGR